MVWPPRITPVGREGQKGIKVGQNESERARGDQTGTGALSKASLPPSSVFCGVVSPQCNASEPLKLSESIQPPCMSHLRWAGPPSRCRSW
ncbi:uncharacterized protein SPSK_04730 [Sporothrix schenckii 1099-18]|uniref:Uncharacterized protein n=1 Tax=Sporothrix schenckii 1099-18 TaxID=1397361 RepID=A0A0F2M5D3_SPOSC|nr:uncharacterized protein SPSK_04730 [Sporothrix schenckii 1099-18]KJR83401.1 hypothetical protein SPSK_04730 [Sporothrix schenckii 1099-18]